jgi:Tat protein translocase TatB subunit
MESFFGIGGPELLLILVLATIILGPLNMIKMARQLGLLLRDVRNYYNSLTANLSQELGDLAELQETMKGKVNAALPKPEELQGIDHRKDGGL